MCRNAHRKIYLTLFVYAVTFTFSSSFRLNGLLVGSLQNGSRHNQNGSRRNGSLQNKTGCHQDGSLDLDGNVQNNLDPVFAQEVLVSNHARMLILLGLNPVLKQAPTPTPTNLDVWEPN